MEMRIRRRRFVAFVGLTLSLGSCGHGPRGGDWGGYVNPALQGTRPTQFDLPFAYTIPPSASRLEVSTPGGTVYVSLGPFGSHFGGHVTGDGKANWEGFLPKDDSEMVELVGNMD